MNTEIIRTKEGVHVLAEDSHLSRWIEQHGRLDIAEGEIAAFAKYIPEGGVVIDAGACLGDHTATYAQLVGPAGKVYAFEANPITCHALRLNFAEASNVEVIGCALGYHPMFDRLTADLNAGASHLSHTGMRVPVLTIDLLGLDRIDFIHLDAEGMEPNIIRGAWNTLLKIRPVMVVEVNHGCLARYQEDEASLLRVLEKNGYRWEEMDPSHGPHLAQRDIICFPK